MADAFHADIVVAEESPGIEQAHSQDFWISVAVYDTAGGNGEGTSFGILGLCRQ